MAIAVLRSQDCLRDRLPRETLTSFPSSPLQPKHGRNPNRSTRSGGRRKRSPSDSESDRSSPMMMTSMVTKFPAKDLVMGQVKILKRGEEIVNNTKNEEKTRSEGIVNNTKKTEGKSRSEEILNNTKKTVEKIRSEEIVNKKKKEEKGKSDVEMKVVEIAEKMKLEVSVVSSNDRLGPEPEMIPKGIRLTDAKSINGETFAGSVFDSSPSPNSLPFPTFTKQVIATKDLRRILGINLL